MGRKSEGNFPCSFDIRTSFRCRPQKYYFVAKICRIGNEESSSQPCQKLMGQSRYSITQSESVLVQVYIYGGNAIKCGWYVCFMNICIISLYVLSDSKLKKKYTVLSLQF